MAISGFEQLKTNLRHTPPKWAVVAAAHDEHTLQAVFAAQHSALIRPLLVGHSDEIRSIATAHGVSLSPEQIIHADSDEACASICVELIGQGRGDMLIKGMLQTGTLLKAVVNGQTGIRSGALMSHVAILDVPSYHKLLFITDGGMVVAPDLEQKGHILKNAVDFCHFLGYDNPKVAALCAVETVSPHMPETAHAAALKERACRGEFGACFVEGPISLDLATNPQAAQVKGYHSMVAGDADILLVPTIVAGNLLGKCLYGLAGGQMAGVVLGGRVPITINSRGATPEEKYSSILICSSMTPRHH